MPRNSPEARLKNSLSKRGKNNPMYGIPSPMKGKHHTDEVKEKIRLSNLGEYNGMWKGDNIQYTAIHSWMRKNYPKPKQCEYCGTNENVDIANITTVYDRDFLNYRWLCRSCHMKLDYRLGIRKHAT